MKKNQEHSVLRRMTLSRYGGEHRELLLTFTENRDKTLRFHVMWEHQRISAWKNLTLKQAAKKFEEVVSFYN